MRFGKLEKEIELIINQFKT